MRNGIIIVLLFICTWVEAQQKVIRLYEGKAPGSESWNWQEQSPDSSMGNTKIIYNVVEPTLTVYPAEGFIRTGTAVIIAPGGGMMLLSMNSEGTEVAEWLSKIGVTAFVLKYRTAHISSLTETRAAMQNPKRLDSMINPVTPLAMNDGLAAVAYVRKNASVYNIDPDRIGFMGFSAGGGVALSVAYNATDETRPNFLAPIYAWDKNIVGSKAPVQKMPAFIVAASDDALHLVPNSIDIYNKWVGAKQSAELIVYQDGGHGFGMRKQDKLSDTWIERFENWLAENNLLWPAHPTGRMANFTYKEYKKSQVDQAEQQRVDWSNRKRFAAANAELKAPKPNEKRVVFMGNSITEFWGRDSSFFIGRPYLNRGISGQTTSQMLLRFREDVIALKPKVVVILAGINDIAENTGPIPLESIFGNIVSMAELAKENGIKVVFSSVLPANVIVWNHHVQPADKVIKLNSMLKAYAAKNKIEYVDYYSTMVDDEKGLKVEYANDAVHPNIAGYKTMELLVEKAITKVLNQK